MNQKTPLISVVVASRANDTKLLQGFFDALKAQSYQAFECILVCDRDFTAQEWSDFCTFIEQQALKEKIKCFSHCNSSFEPHALGGASAVRNFGIEQTQGLFIQLFDDDNTFWADYLQQAIDHYQHFATKGHDVVICPTLLLGKDGSIQNQWFSHYNYRLARPKVFFLPKDQAYSNIQMFSGNGVFAKAQLIKATKYDENIAWIAEDLDFVYRLHQKAQVFVFADLKVLHWEREKNILEQARIGTPASAKQKITNIFLWVKKHGNLSQTLLFLLWSSRWIVLRLAIKALRYWKKQKWQIIKGLLCGYINGRKKFLH